MTATVPQPQVAAFNNAQGISLDHSQLTIQNHSYTFGDNGGRSGFKALKEATAPAAFHNSGERSEPPKCHPRTREAILKKIMSWAKGEIDTDALIFWLNGTVGVGKSAIAQSIAEFCEKENLLLATFFFARSDPTRNNARLLITTLAYQIGRAIPAARHYIEQIFERDPLIHKQSLETQAFQLIIRPLQHSVSQQIEIPSLIIIDGLDECSDAFAQCKVLNTIHRIVSALKTHGVRLLFLVASRPEQEISLTFQSETMEPISSPYTLNESPDSDDDIRHFLEDGFDKIKRTHPLKSSIPSLWPSSNDIEELVWKASGQFLHAKLVIDYTSNIRRGPPDRLDSILCTTPDLDNNPFTALDALYHHIFASIDDVQAVMRILGLCITQLSLSRDSLGFLADIVRDRVNMGFEEVRLLFGDLASIVGVTHNDESTNGWKMMLWHASLEEFLTTHNRSKQYFIDQKLGHTDWAIFILSRNLSIDPQDVWVLPLHLTNSTPHQELQDALQRWDLAAVVAKSPETFSGLYRIIVTARDLEFEDAHLLYTSQLQVLECQLGYLLERFYAAPAYVLLTSRSSVHQHRQLDRFGETIPEALACVTHLDVPLQLDPLCLLSTFRQDFYSFIVTFLHDPSKSVHYAVDGAKLAAAALSLMEYLCRPPEELTKLSWSTRWVPKKLMTSPWTVRSRYAVCKKFKWFKCYNDDGRSFHCDIHNVTRVANFACRVPSSPNMLFLHQSIPLTSYLLASEMLPHVLEKASRSDELIAYCRRHVFHPASILFPCRTRKARAAVWQYLERMEAEDRWYEELWLD